MSLIKALLTFSAGFSGETLEEIEYILKNLWLKKNHASNVSLNKNVIVIANVHVDTLFEILLRSSLITDVRLVLLESQILSKEMLRVACEKMSWQDYLAPTYPIKIKVDSVASELFHEGAMKEIASEVLKQKGFCFESATNLSNNLYIELFKNKMTVSLSLSGSEIYKRNYKKTLSASAPLREDIAHICLKKSVHFLEKTLPKQKISTLFVPFGGTGTFIFEYIILVAELSNNFFGKDFTVESSPVYKEKTFGFLNKKSIQESEKLVFSLKQVIYSDILEGVIKMFEENILFFNKKVEEKSGELFQKMQAIDFKIKEENFLNINVNEFVNKNNFQEDEVVLMPLNPPYGLRQNSKGDSIQFYTKIVQKINEIGTHLQSKKITLCGFILCPTEETWSVAMNKLHTQNKETFHFTQGGVHIRAVSVIY